MSVDVLALVNQCLRWKAEPDPCSSQTSAHRLLERMPIDQRVSLEWAVGLEWQLAIGGKLIYAGSFEDCVTALAARCSR